MVECSVCGGRFSAQFAYQVAVVGQEKRLFCQLECRKKGLGVEAFRSRRARRLAVLNQKGGTGKTTTAVNLAAGIAERGHEVLLVDTDAQGNVGTSLGVVGEKTLYHVLVEGAQVEDVVVPVRSHLDVICSDRMLATAEVWLARLDSGRDRVLAERLGPATRKYQYVVIDCGPSLSLLNQNALRLADEVLIPVSCDYLALVGVKQVMRTLKDIDKHLGHSVRLTGVVPTFYDGRTKLSQEAVETLRGHFKERLFDPIRRNTKLAEAPSHRQTIFEYAPDSHGAEDYHKLIDRFVDQLAKYTAPPVARVAAELAGRGA
ncbi:MAG: ParA family protein [Myxococcales bacterium]|nr:ParA family protein [Myxococcales bacterium]